MADPSSTSGAIVEATEEYPYPSHVFVQNFVTVRLAGRDSYKLWKTQMLCLLESHGMLGFIDGTLVSPTQSCSKLWRRSDARVKGWILGSLSPQTLSFILDRLHPDPFTAKDVWDKLQSMYGPALLLNTIQQDGNSDKKEERIRRKIISTIIADLMPEDAKAKEKEKQEAKEKEKQEAKKKEKQEAKERENILLSLYKAILRGSWAEVDRILNTKHVTVTDKISINGNTALHVAVGTTKKKEFVKKMLEVAPADCTLLGLRNSEGSTLLHVAATVGNIDVVKELVSINSDLLLTKDKDGRTPLARALSNMHTETYLYLLESTKSDLEQATLSAGTGGDELLVNAISAKDFQSARTLMVSNYCTLNSDAALMAMAQNYPSKFSYRRSRLKNSLTNQVMILSNIARRFGIRNPYWKRCLISAVLPIHMLLFTALWLKEWPFRSSHLQKHRTLLDAKRMLNAVCRLIRDSYDSSSQHCYYSNPILEAARLNAYMVVERIVHYFPNAIWSENEHRHNIIQYAVINRSEQVYNLLYQMSEHKNIYKTIKDPYGNNLLHLAGRLAPTDKLNLISGAALQIQHELQWFQEVEGFVCPLNKIQKNSFGETPQMVFTREHKDLVIEGEKWMKATAESYTITAALITTIVFAAAITVPGGSNQDTGIPVFTNDTAFTIFAVSDAISLFTSTTSLLMFLSILTARFAEQDFLFNLPTKLIIGLTTLFISTTAMIVAFGATLFLVFGQRKPWILGPIAALTCLPIASFVTLQYPLIADFMSATFGRSIFGKKRDEPFY